MRRKSFDKMSCPIARSLERVGEWWSMLIMRDALHGMTRFDEFQNNLGIAPNMLTRRLNSLVEAGLLERRRYSEHPPRHEYVPTARGRDLRPVVIALLAWGNKHFAPEGLDYARDRYQFEARRHYGILDAHLAKGPYLVGTTYTIADMSAWGWTRAVPFILGDDAWEDLPHLKRWFDLISARPAAVRANALKDKYTFKPNMDAEARRHMFRHLTTA